MRFSDFPFLRYLPFLLLGVFLSKTGWIIPWQWPLILLLALMFSYGFLALKSKSPTLLSGLGYLQMLVLGFFCSLLHLQSSPDWSKSPVEKEYIAEVQNYDLIKPNSFENLLEIKFVKSDSQWLSASGKVLIYHQSNTMLEPGELIWIQNPPEEIPAAINPYEFDYRGYLAKKDIRYRQFIGNGFRRIDSSSGNSLRFWMAHWRQKMSTMLRETIPGERAQQIALALLLGQKQQLDRDTKKAYSEAGVMHVLAVSGLHVGILVGVLLLLIKPLRLSKRAKKGYLIGVLLIIWAYAMLTGMAPSVIRASVMFSLLTLGQLRERKPSIFNILAFSAILMIVFNPDVIFEVGFQLSYTAVAGIVLIQPLIARLWIPSNLVLEYLWQLAAVSIAAQLATFPLSVFYFHTFPTWFLLANMLVIPLTFVIMQLGIPLMILGWIPALGKILGFVLGLLLELEIWILDGFKLLPWTAIDFLSISIYSMLLIWAFLLLWAAWDSFSKKVIIRLALILIVAWGGINFWKELHRPSRQAVFYATDSAWFVDFWENQKLRSWNYQVKDESLDFIIKPNRIQNQWAVLPEPLIGFQSAASQIYFPEVDLEVLADQNLFFGPLLHKGKLQKWENGVWQDENSRDSLKVQGAAFRIIF
ncbi:competence protein ComEC [Algoriphagus faecimaris]|uniref:Competence protein ComEC n=1 Tax=Algoriphagus faecimaris TaxID=686796 RepID=A0A1G6VX04_9BACT|nr:ComEC/Rec2 family competence protein [Algoriphagus faecimaris]SDD57346.1 competence protein ComEC [Algoriphagus faecimaris]